MKKGLWLLLLIISCMFMGALGSNPQRVYEIVIGYSTSDTDGNAYIDHDGNILTEGKITTAASTTSSAGFNLPHGTAPTSPVNGDMWTTNSGGYIRINGVTVGPLGTGGGGAEYLDELTDVVITSAASGELLLYNGSNWADVAMSGDVTINGSGATVIGANTVALTTDTVGDYVAVVTAGGGLISDGAPGEGTTYDISFDFTIGNTGDHTIQGHEWIPCSDGFVAEGTVADAYELYFLFDNPTGSDKTVTVPAITGTLITTGDTGTVTGTMIADGTVARADTSITGTPNGSQYLRDDWTWQSIPSGGDNTYVNTVASTDFDITTGNGISVTLDTAPSPDTATLALGNLTANWNQTGAFDVVLNNASAEIKILESVGNTYYGTLDVTDLDANRTYTLPNVSGTVITTGDTATVTDTVAANDLTINSSALISSTAAGTNSFGSNTGATNTYIKLNAAANKEVGIELDAAGTAEWYVYTPASSSDLRFSNGATNVVSINSAGDLSLLTANSELKILESTGATYYGVLDVADLDAERTYTLPNVSGTVVTTGDTASVTGTMITNDTVALTTDTSGNYVASVANGNGITGGSAGSEGAALTLAADVDMLATYDTQTGNVGTGEDTLYTYTIPAGKLATDKDSICFKATFLVGVGTENKRFKIYFGGSGGTAIYDSGTVAAAALTVLFVEGVIIRDSATTQTAFVWATTNNVGFADANFTLPTQTLSGTVDLLFTGTATTNDACQIRLAQISWKRGS